MGFDSFTKLSDIPRVFVMIATVSATPVVVMIACPTSGMTAVQAKTVIEIERESIITVHKLMEATAVLTTTLITERACIHAIPLLSLNSTAATTGDKSTKIKYENAVSCWIVISDKPRKFRIAAGWMDDDDAADGGGVDVGESVGKTQLSLGSSCSIIT